MEGRLLISRTLLVDSTLQAEKANDSSPRVGWVGGGAELARAANFEMCPLGTKIRAFLRLIVRPSLGYVYFFFPYARCGYISSFENEK